jgi:hypothetical protein
MIDINNFVSIEVLMLCLAVDYICLKIKFPPMPWIFPSLALLGIITAIILDGLSIHSVTSGMISSFIAIGFCKAFDLVIDKYVKQLGGSSDEN